MYVMTNELKNPDINIGELNNLYLSKGSIFKLDYNLNKGDQTRVYFPLCQYIHDLLKDDNDEDIIVECEYNNRFEKWEPIKKTLQRIHHVNDLEIL